MFFISFFLRLELYSNKSHNYKFNGLLVIANDVITDGINPSVELLMLKILKFKDYKYNFNRIWLKIYSRGWIIIFLIFLVPMGWPNESSLTDIPQLISEDESIRLNPSKVFLTQILMLVVDTGLLGVRVQ